MIDGKRITDREILETPITYQDLVEATRLETGGRYSRLVTERVTAAFLRALCRAMGTCRPVKLSQVGQVQLGVRKGRRNGGRKEVSGVKLRPQLKLNQMGRQMVFAALRQTNYLDKPDKAEPNQPIAVIPKRYRC